MSQSEREDAAALVAATTFIEELLHEIPVAGRATWVQVLARLHKLRLELLAKPAGGPRCDAN